MSSLTPFASLADWRRALPPVAVDVVIVAVCLVYAVTQMVREKPFVLWMAQSEEAQPFEPWLLLVAVFGCLVLLWRRRYPFTVALLCGISTTTLAMAHVLGELPAAQLVATYTFAALCTPTQRLVAVLGTIVGVLTSAGWKITQFREIGIDLALAGLCFTIAYTLGVGARARQDRIAMLEERAARHAEEQAAAATRERERIAREMHDILAHSMSMISIQAEAGPLVVRDDPAKAERMFDTIADTSREALAQLRRALGVLRDEGRNRRPAPGLNALEALVEDVRHAGLEATLEREGEPRAITQDLEITAYRIVQEALTNTVKHAAARTVQLRLTWQDEALAVEVCDDGRGPPGNGNDKGGHGLVGMRERVAAVGGDLVTGPGPDGQGYRVAASLPLLRLPQ